ncbi:bifunctional nicotinamide-nucleotide adenylyltransferase/Nudix hydroxylase [Viridibacterium curvum]|uniref:Bifunctional nicotinamide-nucleotide adenylyltransferase/Nudix hydroxylase n=1 Tax=Viridibacterium curvum TaxID=1101404 RepID=A0ABP9QH08_9RHOO
MSSHDVAVLIGRFQPFHKGHAALLEKALATAPRVIVVLGSSLQARNAKNPFTWEERAAMIGTVLDDELKSRVSFVPMRDYYDDARWSMAVLSAIEGMTQPGQRVALVGYLKDASSQYLNRFPDWEFIGMPQQGDFDATSVRQIYFEGEDAAVTRVLLEGLLPISVVHYLKGWARLPHFANMQAEHLSIESKKKKWGTGPFITVDAVVTAADHVLLVKRGFAPGKDLWALPGGFLESRERVMQGAIRELREETGLALLETTLEGAFRSAAVFDHPDRSLRGRTITHAHHFDLRQGKLPEVAGADDAAEARWTPIAELKGMEDRFFEDHFNILNHFLALTN